MTNSCIFCKIVNGEIPSTKIYEDDNVLAFLDLSPVHKGHALIITKKHYENLFDADGKEISNIGKVLPKIVNAVKKGVNADGVVVTQNNGTAAGQVVFHVHFHIIPRFKDDGLQNWPQGVYEDNEISSYADKIKQFL
jgi:histidine triad (HIT) family protein